jgi:DNA-binding beta-propeller fold protein YncE
MQMNSFRNSSRILRGLIAGLLWMGLSVSAFAQSQYFPTYTPGPLGSGWVVANGQIVTPAGTQVNLAVTESSGTGVRAKAIALNPNPASNGHRTAAVLTLGSKTVSGAVQIFDVTTGTILQAFVPNGHANGSTAGIAYTPDGSHLLFSQDNSYVTVASVAADGTLTYVSQVNFPLNTSFITCFPNSPPGTTGSAPVPCGTPLDTATAYPLGLAISPNGTTAYSVLDTDDTLTEINLTTNPPTQVAEIRVGNVPNSVVLSSNGSTAYVSNEGGRVATPDDFQEFSNGTNVVGINPQGGIATATISVVNLDTFTLTNTITLTGLHPTGMALWGQYQQHRGAEDQPWAADRSARHERRWPELRAARRSGLWRGTKFDRRGLRE